MVAIINATPVSVRPALAGLAAGYPEAEPWTLLDDRLVKDAEAAGGLTEPLARRMRTLITYAVDSGASAVLLSCSMYGPVLQQARLDHPHIPMTASDEALFAEVAERADDTVLLLGPLAPAVSDTASRLQAVLDAAGSPTALRPHVVDGAAAATARGDLAGLDELLIQAVETNRDDRLSAVVLANFSISPARAAVQAATALPVLEPTTPAARALRRRVTEAVGDCCRWRSPAPGTARRPSGPPGVDRASPEVNRASRGTPGGAR
ncbi:aspartate/glutamate racemase family protein [Nostocoides japonicum]|nr:aspartate/glutamate racemase family protein [Tetrasphaera japonica]